MLKKSLIYILDELKSLQKQASEEKQKSKVIEVKPTLEEVIEKLFSIQDNSGSDDTVVNRIKDIFENSNYSNLSLIKGVEERFKKHLLIVLEKLALFLDKEELELNKFLQSKREFHYFIWVTLLASVIISGMILYILTNIIEGGFYLFYIIFLVVTMFNDIQDYINRKFNKGHYRFIKNKKFLKKFDDFLSLIFYNSHFRTFKEYSDLNQNYNLFKERTDNYRKKVSPNIDYFKRFEFIAILGLIIGYFYPLFQPSIMIDFISVHWIDLILALMLIFGVFIIPFINRRKDKTIIEVQSNLREELKESIRVINYCILIYNLKL